MTNTPGQAQTGAVLSERVLARLRPHARALFWPSLALFATAGAVGYFAGTFPQLWENVVVCAAGGAIVVLLFLLPLGSWLSKRYTITSRRLIIRRGFFVRVRQELPHSRGYEVTLRRNWVQSAFRSGDIRIDGGLENPLVLKDVPRASLVQSALQDLMESSRMGVPAPSGMEQPVPGETRSWGPR